MVMIVQKPVLELGRAPPSWNESNILREEKETSNELKYWLTRMFYGVAGNDNLNNVIIFQT